MSDADLQKCWVCEGSKSLQKREWIAHALLSVLENDLTERPEKQDLDDFMLSLMRGIGKTVVSHGKMVYILMQSHQGQFLAPIRRSLIELAAVSTWIKKKGREAVLMTLVDTAVQMERRAAWMEQNGFPERAARDRNEADRRMQAALDRGYAGAKLRMPTVGEIIPSLRGSFIPFWRAEWSIESSSSHPTFDMAYTAHWEVSDPDGYLNKIRRRNSCIMLGSAYYVISSLSTITLIGDPYRETLKALRQDFDSGKVNRCKTVTVSEREGVPLLQFAD